MYITGQRFIVIDGMRTMHAAGESWRAFRARLGDHALMYLISLGLSIVAGLALAIPIVIVAVATIVPAGVAAAGRNWGLFAGMVAIFGVLILVLSLAFSRGVGHVHLGDVDDLLPPPHRPRSARGAARRLSAARARHAADSSRRAAVVPAPSRLPAARCAAPPMHAPAAPPMYRPYRRRATAPSPHRRPEPAPSRPARSADAPDG